MDDAGTAVPITLDEDISVLVYQLERGESGTAHFQGKLQFFIINN